MPLKIKTIEVRAFRGIPQLEIPLNGKSLLLKGDNGTGKSSFVEAFEFFFTGTVSHLEGIQGISPTRHAPHVGYSEDDVRVVITFDPGSVPLTRTFSDEPIPPQNLTPYFESACRGSFILKRSQILQFIVSRPADRFRALASIIGLEMLDDIELEMMRTRDDLSGELEAAESSVTAIYSALSTDLGTTISDNSEVLPALNILLNNAKLPPIETLGDIETHSESMLKSVKTVASVESVSFLTTISSQVATPIFTGSLTELLAQLSQITEPLIDEKVQLELKLADLLQLGLSLIEQDRLEECPLCSQLIETEALISNIKKRITTLQDLSQKASEARQVASRLSSTIGAAQTRVSELKEAVQKHEDLEIPTIEGLSTTPFFEFALNKIDDTASLRSLLPLNEVIDSVEGVEALWKQLIEEINAEIARLGVTEEERHLLDMVRLIGAVKEKVDRIGIAIQRLERLRIMARYAELIYQSFSQAKREKVSEIYTAIEEDVRRFYSLIHPGEEHTDIELRLRTGRRASTDLRISSFGRTDEDPRALTSEGHLDSLGLCIFLAFVKRFGGECSLLVLDDVVTTIDSGHRQRVCDLILNEFADYQLVLTTHDGVWFREFGAAQRALGRDNDFQNLEIASWNLEGGPRIEKFLPRVEYIERRIQDNDKIGAGNESRTYLEWLLKQIAIHTNASIPVVNWLSGMVGGLESHVSARLLSLVRDSAYSTQVRQAFETLRRTAIFGNIASHDNILADQVTLAEIEEFFRAIQVLHRLVSCSSCDTALEYVRDTHEFRCVNTRCRSPLVLATT